MSNMSNVQLTYKIYSEYETLPLPSTGIRLWEQDFQLRYR